MRRTYTKFEMLAFALLVSTVANSQAQGTFQFELYEQQPGGAWFYGGFGSFSIVGGSGQFEVNVVDPYASDSFSPLMVTPSGTLSFSLGIGVPTIYPVGPFGDRMNGDQYVGSFLSSPDVLSDLLAGRGEFRLTSDSPAVLLSGSIVVVPEPSLCALLLCAIASVLWRRARST
jgi:hypothetical protein